MLFGVFLGLEVALNLDEFAFGTDSCVYNERKLLLVFIFDNIDVLPGGVLNFLPLLFIFGQQLINLKLQLFALLILFLLLQVVLYPNLFVLFFLNQVQLGQLLSKLLFLFVLEVQQLLVTLVISVHLLLKLTLLGQQFLLV